MTRNKQLMSNTNTYVNLSHCIRLFKGRHYSSLTSPSLMRLSKAEDFVTKSWPKVREFTSHVVDDTHFPVVDDDEGRTRRTGILKF